LVGDGRTKAGVHNTLLCEACGFLHNPENDAKSLTANDYEAERLGDVGKFGREYAFAKAALPFAKGESVTACVFGTGMSKDYLNLKTLPRVEKVGVADLQNYLGVDDFIDISARKPLIPIKDLAEGEQPEQETFDIVVASEVIEHFEKPIEHFGTLLGFVSEGGVAVLGTSFVGSMPVSRLTYPFFDGHVGIWSDASLARVGRIYGFKTVVFQTTFGNERKRIIAMTRSTKTYEKLRTLFEKKKVFA
jgi:SAM-dependent methyltransferase